MNSTPIKAMRESAGISQRELGRRAGISSGRMSIIERGVPATADEAERINRILAELLLKPKEGQS